MEPEPSLKARAVNQNTIVCSANERRRSAGSRRRTHLSSFINRFFSLSSSGCVTLKLLSRFARKHQWYMNAQLERFSISSRNCDASTIISRAPSNVDSKSPHTCLTHFENLVEECGKESMEVVAAVGRDTSREKLVPYQSVVLSAFTTSIILSNSPFLCLCSSILSVIVRMLHKTRCSGFEHILLILGLLHTTAINAL